MAIYSRRKYGMVMVTKSFKSIPCNYILPLNEISCVRTISKNIAENLFNWLNISTFLIQFCCCCIFLVMLYSLCNPHALEYTRWITLACHISISLALQSSNMMSYAKCEKSWVWVFSKMPFDGIKRSSLSNSVCWWVTLCLTSTTQDFISNEIRKERNWLNWACLQNVAILIHSFIRPGSD